MSLSGVSGHLGEDGGGGDGGTKVVRSGTVSQSDLLRLKYTRANALVSSILNKYYNGSPRAVDPFVIRCLQKEETRLFSMQCFLEEGPTEQNRAFKESSALKNARMPPQSTSFLNRLFPVCAGYCGSSSVMRRWDALSEAGDYDEAMAEYIGVVDKILPGWDHAIDYPVSRQCKFWKDDSTTDQCHYCGAHFGIQTRRHHCRMCFEIFCIDCCAATIELALCPGAPLRKQRVCCQCLQDIERNNSLLEVRRIIRENHELEQNIKEIQATTESIITAKQREEAQLREEASACGCDMVLLDTAIQAQIGSPVSILVKTPPSHKFAPRETVEANDQLALANRQLLMGLKAAQCRAKKAIEKMDVTLAVLRDAIYGGNGTNNSGAGAITHWHATILYHILPYMTLYDIKRLGIVCKGLHVNLKRLKCEEKCILKHGVAPPAMRGRVWQVQCLKNDKTRAYVVDLAEEIRTRLDSSDSETDDSDSNGMIGGSQSPSHLEKPQWYSLLSAQEDPVKKSLWMKSYEIILARCQSCETPMEYDEQIRNDVQRTFGVSALRRLRRKSYHCTSTQSQQQPIDLPIETRQKALTNVLRAFSSVNTEIGYCQGMDYVTAVLLAVSDWNEANAFWLLTSMVASPRYELEFLYCTEIPHLSLRCFQLEKLIQLHLPELSAHLKELEFPVSVFATGWFMTLFTNMEALSYDVLVRVLDGFFIVGWKYIFRVALVIVEMLQHQILASSFEEIPQIFYDIQGNAPRLLLPGVVMQMAVTYKVTNGMLKRLQQEYETSLSPRVASSHGAAATTNKLMSKALPATPPSDKHKNGLEVKLKSYSSKAQPNIISNGTTDQPQDGGELQVQQPFLYEAQVPNVVESASSEQLAPSNVSPTVLPSTTEMETVNNTTNGNNNNNQTRRNSKGRRRKFSKRRSSSSSHHGDTSSAGDSHYRTKSPDATRDASPAESTVNYAGYNF